MAKSKLRRATGTILAGGLSLALAAGMVGCGGGAGSSAAGDPSSLGKGEYNLNDDSIEPSTWEEAGSPEVSVTGSGCTVMSDDMINIAFVVESQAEDWAAESLPVTISVQGENGVGDAAVVLGTVYPGQSYAYSLNMEQLQFTRGGTIPQYADVAASDEAESNDTSTSALIVPAYAEEADAEGDVPEGDDGDASESAPVGDASEGSEEGSGDEADDVIGVDEVVETGISTITDGPIMAGIDEIGAISQIEVRAQPISANWRKTDITEADLAAAFKAGEAQVEEEDGNVTLTAPVSMDTRYIGVVRDPSSDGIAMGATVLAVFKNDAGDVIYGSTTQVALLMDDELSAKDDASSDGDEAATSTGQGSFDGDTYKTDITMVVSGIPSDREWSSYEIYVNPGL